jgi:dTDP-glucose pyrophosphorylase
MLNIVIPMAGRGSRFSQAGYSIPKPFLPIHGVPMAEVVVRNLRPLSPHRFILIYQESQKELGTEIAATIRTIGSEVVNVAISKTTEGAACTVLEASEVINTDEPLMIANSDQWVDCSINEYIATMDRSSLDGLIMTMEASDPKWSFCDLSASNLVTRVVEKEVISNIATVGIYNFRRGHEFVSAARQMIERDLRVNGEFYVAPTYNQLIENGARIGIFNVGSERDGMYGLGIPDDYEWFLTQEVSQKASRRM